jgi:hypothetical protein
VNASSENTGSCLAGELRRQGESDGELARRLSAETRRDYLFFLEETARFVLGLEEEKGEVTVSADID